MAEMIPPPEWGSGPNNPNPPAYLRRGYAERRAEASRQFPATLAAPSKSAASSSPSSYSDRSPWTTSTSFSPPRRPRPSPPGHAGPQYTPCGQCRCWTCRWFWSGIGSGPTCPSTVTATTAVDRLHAGTAISGSPTCWRCSLCTFWSCPPSCPTFFLPLCTSRANGSEDA